MINSAKTGSFPDKRTQILEATVIVLAAKGFEATKIAEIAREAGIGKGTVYEYFSSKEDLFEQAIQHATKMHAQMLTNALEAGENLEDSLERALMASLVFCETSRPTAQVLLNNPVGRGGASLGDWLLGFRRQMVEMIAKTIRRHRGPDFPRDPEIAANVFLGALNNLSLAQILDDGTTRTRSLKATTKEAVAIILEGLGREA